MYKTIETNKKEKSFKASGNTVFPICHRLSQELAKGLKHRKHLNVKLNSECLANYRYQKSGINIISPLHNTNLLKFAISTNSYMYYNDPKHFLKNMNGIPKEIIAGLQMLINGFIQTKDNNYYIGNFLEFMDKDPKENVGHIPFQQNNNLIEFKNVTFSYPRSSHNVLRNISFKVATPSLVAIVGETGSGKSTLVKLLMRMFDVGSGEILVNGIPIQEILIEDLRKQMSGVFQDPARFSFSIRDNLAFGNINEKSDSNYMMEACESANLKEVINGLPDGLDTMLGKEFANGTDLSGGQWQKISLARAFCTKASILIFDEASSDLDPKAEKVFYDSVRSFAQDKIAFYITHRLSGTKDADLILVLQEGELVEVGSHDELIKKEGVYSKLYCTQAMGYDLG